MKSYLRDLLKSNVYTHTLVSRVLDRIPFYFFKNLDYRENIETLKRYEKLSPEQINKWKYETLFKVIENAFNNVPFYSKLYKEHGFNPRDFNKLEDMDLLPMISKVDVKNNLEDFISIRAKKNELMVKYSSGSTETPFKFYVERMKERIEASYFDYIWRKYGYKFAEDKCIIIKGDKIAHHKGNKLVLSRYSPRLRTLTFDSDYLNKLEYLQYYLDDFKKFGSEVLFGYPSSIYQLARSIEISGFKAPEFRLILLASENTYADQNEYIKNIFGAQNIFFHYGHSEQVLAAYKLLDSDRLSFIPTYGHVELIKNSENILGKDNFSIGELVGTNYSLSFPLIRFRTNDFAMNSSEGDSIFADQAIVNSIEGRLQEFIVTKDSRLISACTVAGAHLASVSKALEMQYVQHKPGFLVVQIVENPVDPLMDSDIKQLVSDLDRKFEFSVSTSVEIVASIPKLASHKRSMVNQALDTEKYLGS